MKVNYHIAVLFLTLNASKYIKYLCKCWSGQVQILAHSCFLLLSIGLFSVTQDEVSHFTETKLCCHYSSLGGESLARGYGQSPTFDCTMAAVSLLFNSDLYSLW